VSTVTYQMTDFSTAKTARLIILLALISCNIERRMLAQSRHRGKRTSTKSY